MGWGNFFYYFFRVREEEEVGREENFRVGVGEWVILSSVGQFSVFHFRPIGGKRVVFKQGGATFFSF